MYRPQQRLTAPARTGVILLVVVVLLAVFALVGIAFVFYTSSESTSSRIFREAQTIEDNPAGESPDALLRFFLGQYIYDQDDITGISSSMRGHSLARTIYGWNHDDTTPATPATMAKAGTNILPFNGVGRLHNTHTEPIITGQDDYNLVNYMYYQSDGFARDPERLGVRTPGATGQLPPVTTASEPYVGGFNAPYTYPDLNNMHLAAVQADGTVLMQSFFRPWTGSYTSNTPFGSLDPANPNWTLPNPWLKYEVLRPRPAENPGFPAPVSAGGDVKNLLGSPGTLVNGTLYNEDSIWMDLNYPVKQAADGTYYKPLFAALCVDLDNRVNVNVHGNIRASGVTAFPGPHGSNQGWGKWEVDLGQVLTAQNTAGNGQEWPNLFSGIPTPQTSGRYANGKINNQIMGNTLPQDMAPFFYGQVDYDAVNESNSPYTGTSPFVLPGGNLPGGGTWASYNCFPFYDNNGGWGDENQAERTQHPALFDYYLAANNAEGGDRVFDASNMKKLLYNMGADVASSDLGLLCPNNFNNPADAQGSLRRRNLVTTSSFDVDRPGGTPWVWDPNQVPYGLAGPSAFAAGTPYPSGQPAPGAIPFPTLPPTVPPSASSEFAADWRGVTAALGRVDLNRALTPYPAPDATTHRLNPNDPTLQQAVLDRQNLARDIFITLVKVTGAYDLTAQTPTAPPSQAQFDALRWLAQLAVNIVDYRDEDDYITPFNWTAYGSQAFQTTALTLDTNASVKGWVFGTEVPRVVINEGYVEIDNDPTDPLTGGKATLPYKVNFWVELHNPMYAGAPLTEKGLGRLQVPAGGGSPAYPAYELAIAKAPNANIRQNNNVLGDPDANNTINVVADFTPDPTAPQPVAGVDINVIQPSSGAYADSKNGNNDGFYVLGPKADFPGTSPTKPIATLRVKDEAATVSRPRSAMVYEVPITTGLANLPQHTLLLRRLACPYLPPQADPTKLNYNPYVTVDYVDGVQTQEGRTATATGANVPPIPDKRVSYGKYQPFAADLASKQILAQAPNPANTKQPQHTFFRHNGTTATPPNGADPTLKFPFDWLVQPDRQLISPMELLQVSAYKPHELTQQFMTTQTFTHLAPWYDPTSRLYRAFEYLECHDRASGMSVGGRQPGKININTIFDPETLMALSDPQNANSNSFTSNDVLQNIFPKMMNLRTPVTSTVGTTTYHVPGPKDVPFWSLAAPFSAGDKQYGANGFGIKNTFLRDDGSATNPKRLFQGAAPTHPYLQAQLMSKIFNNVTTRSNVFAVFLTVGFFQVTDTTKTPVVLGPEVGAATQQTVRHRMFAIVDRTPLALGPKLATGQSPVQVTPGVPTPQTVQVDNLSGVTANNVPWQIQPPTQTQPTVPTQLPVTLAQGSTLVVDSGANQETVIVTAVNTARNTFTASFIRNHQPGFGITIPGNPGPQPGFDQHNQDYSQVVPYFVILQ